MVMVLNFDNEMKYIDKFLSVLASGIVAVIYLPLILCAIIIGLVLNLAQRFKGGR